MIRKNRVIVMDKIKRKNFLKTEIKILMLRSIFQNRQLKSTLRFVCKLALSINSKKIFLSKQKKKCVFSGNSKGIFKNFEINRHVIKRFNNVGFIQGVTTSKW